MTTGEFNLLAIPAAAAAGFAFGAAWYMTLGKAWMSALETNAAALKAKVSSPIAFGTAAVAQLVIAFFLVELAWLHDPLETRIDTALLLSSVIWLAFILPTMAVNHRFQGATFRLTAIDSLHWLGVLLVQGLVIGLIG